MVKIALAGGTGALGRTILDVLVQSASKHEVITLSRKSPELPTGHRSVQVDYDDVFGLRKHLEDNGIEVVIATFHMSMGALQAQLNLIEAASRSECTYRFIPTSFAIPYPYGAKSELKPLQLYFDGISALEKTSLEWTAVHNGLFLDYFAMPYIKTHLSPNVIAIDVAHEVAAIPGTGDVPVTFTHTYDVAKFVIASLDLPTWSRESRIVGETLTWNQFTDLAEATLGINLNRQYDSVEKLKSYEVTELPGHVPLYDTFPKKTLQWFLSLFELWTTDGTANVPIEGSLNEVFPEIETMSIRQMLELWRQ